MMRFNKARIFLTALAAASVAQRSSVPPFPGGFNCLPWESCASSITAGLPTKPPWPSSAPIVPVASQPLPWSPDSVVVYLCTGEGFTGTCLHMVSVRGACVDLSAFSYFGNVASVGPDPGAQECIVFTGSQCDGRGSPILTWPGSGDTTAFGLGEVFNSYSCR